MAQSTQTLFSFAPDQANSRWRIQDDVVMGGRSNGNFEILPDNQARFYGNVSLENNGGFSSARYSPSEPVEVSDYGQFCLRIKGDGKNYTFRVKRPGDRHSYAYSFATSGEWETIEIPFNEMRPVFRGYQLNYDNYQGEPVAEFRILIGNKKPQVFELLIDHIEVK